MIRNRSPLLRAAFVGVSIAGWLGCAEKAPAAPVATDRPSASSIEPAAQAFVALPCDPRTGTDDDTERERRARGAALRLADEVDYVSVRRVASWETLTIAERGTRCAEATDLAACESAIEALEKTSAPAAVPCPDGFNCAERMYVVTTRDGKPAIASSPDEVKRLLGPIDTPYDAWLLAQATHHIPPYLCGDAETSAARSVAGGYELRERHYTKRCDPVELTEHTYRVAQDGTVQDLGSRVVRSEPTCVSD